MTLIKKNLKTVKNKLLCELEDYLIDSILPQIAKGSLDEGFANELMQTLIKAVKENDVRFAIICYTSEDGKELSEEDLIDIPLKLKVMQECMPEIMEIMSDYFQESNGDKAQGKLKAKPIRKKSSAS